MRLDPVMEKTLDIHAAACLACSFAIRTASLINAAPFIAYACDAHLQDDIGIETLDLMMAADNERRSGFTTFVDKLA